MIRQGEVYWSDLGTPVGSAPGYRRPVVVVQSNAFNASALGTVIVCAITSNPRRAESPGNVLLRAGEGGLPRQSVANVTQLFTADHSELLERIGALSRRRVLEIIAGIHLVLEPAEF